MHRAGRCSWRNAGRQGRARSRCAVRLHRRPRRLRHRDLRTVEGAVKLGEAAFGTLIGPGLLDNFAGMIADDLPTNIQAVRSFVRACIVKPVSDDDFETAVCWNVVVPAEIRANLAARELDCDDVLGSLNVPLLVTQGRADSVVLPAMAEHILTTCPTSEASWYRGVGHVPHLETPKRFNRELAALTRRACP